MKIEKLKNSNHLLINHLKFGNDMREFQNLKIKKNLMKKFKFLIRESFGEQTTRQITNATRIF